MNTAVASGGTSGGASKEPSHLSYGFVPIICVLRSTLLIVAADVKDAEGGR